MEHAATCNERGGGAVKYSGGKLGFASGAICGNLLKRKEPVECERHSIDFPVCILQLRYRQILLDLRWLAPQGKEMFLEEIISDIFR